MDESKLEKALLKNKKLEKKIQKLNKTIEEKDRRINELEHVVEVYSRFLGGNIDA